MTTAIAPVLPVPRVFNTLTAVVEEPIHIVCAVVTSGEAALTDAALDGPIRYVGHAPA